MKKYHEVESVEINENKFKVRIDGKEYTFDLEKISKRLKGASIKDRNAFVISPSGYGISWPAIDEDLSIDSLLGIKHEPKFNRNKKAS